VDAAEVPAITDDDFMELVRSVPGLEKKMTDAMKRNARRGKAASRNDR
jgi:hypothetical protein